jgi:hypothetical protein
MKSQSRSRREIRMPSEGGVTITLSEEERLTLIRWLEEKHGLTSVHYRQMIELILLRLHGLNPKAED